MLGLTDKQRLTDRNRLDSIYWGERHLISIQA